jgi:hypothetical protein
MVNFTLSGLNQAFTLDVSGQLAGEAAAALDVSCIAIYNVKLTDMQNVFKFQSDSFDVNDTDASDIKYYVDMANWPANLQLNPVHAHSLSTHPILLDSADIVAEKNLVKHDFVRYLAEMLFNTPHGVDLFSNEEELLSDLVSKGSAAYTSIKASLDAVNMSSAAAGTSPNKYSTNAQNTTANFSRELLRQVAHHAPARFAGIANQTTIQSIPLAVNDTISFKTSISPYPAQHTLTERPNAFNTRVYEIKLVLKDAVDATNVAPVEAGSGSEYPYYGV